VAAGRATYFDFFLLTSFLMVSLTVVFGFFFTVACLTNRPVMALRPRFPLAAIAFLLPGARFV
jgi:hypothetical protein